MHDDGPRAAIAGRAGPYDDVAAAEDFAHARRVLNGILGDAI